MADDKKKTIEELVKAIKELGKEDRKAILEGVKEGTEDSAKQQQQLNELSDKHLETLRETAAILNDIEQVRRQDLEIGQRQLMQAVELKNAGEDPKIAKERVEKARQYIQELKEGKADSLSDAAKKLDMDEEELGNISKKIKLSHDAIEGQRKFGAAQKKVLKQMASAIGMSKDYKDSFLGAVVELNKGLGSADPNERGQALQALADNYKQIFNLQNAALAVFNKMYENASKLFKEFDKAQASLAAATGQGQEFNSVLYGVQRNANLYGVSMAEAGEAIATLVEQTSYFGDLSKQQQANVATNVAMMKKLNVATSDSAAIFQNFNQGLGIAADEAIRMQTELAMAGVGAGISASKITKDFNASLKTLMVYGKGSVDVFKGLAAAAKAAGVEVSTLLTLAGKFDTFQGAAETVGKMNALLGTQLSTTQMLMMTEDERIRTLVESVQAQGVAFKDMDRFTQKAIANAAGITDMAEANRIFGMSLSEYDENERKLNNSANAQKKFEDAVAATTPVLDKFRLLGAELIVSLEPLFEVLSNAADAMTKFFKSMSKEDKEMLANVIMGLSGFILLIPVFKVGGALLTGLSVLGGAALPAVGAGAAAAAPAVGALGGSMMTLGGGVLAVVGPVVLLVAAIAGLVAAYSLVVEGISYVIDAFANLASVVGSGIGSFLFGTDEAEMAMEEFQARAAEAMATIVTGDHSGALESIKQIAAEVNKMGQDVKVSSTIENLALVTAGKATDMTGKRVEASSVNVVSNVKNSFEGMKMVLEVGGEKIEGVIQKIAAKTANGEIV